MQYLKRFFEEKALPVVHWELEVGDVVHIITNTTVIKAILAAPRSEQEQIANMLRRIDFLNGDVNDYLRHLAVPLCEAANARMGF